MSSWYFGVSQSFRNLRAVNSEKKYFVFMFSKNYRNHGWRQPNPRPGYRSTFMTAGPARPLWATSPQPPTSQHYGFSQFAPEIQIRSVKCGELRASDCGQEIEIAGRVQNLRMNRFLMLRDETGITQLVAPDERADLLKKMIKLPMDSYIKLRGQVLLRPEGSRNETIATGSIEVLIIDFITVQHKRKQASEDDEVGERKRSKTKSAGIKLTTEEVAKAETMAMRSYFAVRKATCSDLGTDFVNPGDEITLCGWVQTKRPPLFVVLKDGYGEIQLVPSSKSDVANCFKDLKTGSVIFVKGILARRPFGQGNPRVTNGLLEVSVSEVTIVTKDSPVCVESVETSSVEYETERPIATAAAAAAATAVHPNKYTQRTHTCGELRATNVGKTVTLMGWVEFVRMSKFLILRDGYGSTQVLISDTDETSSKILNDVSLESILEVTGTVCNRPSSQVKKDSDTGEIEVLASKLTLLNEADRNLPFSIRDFKKAQEPLRMKHRYLDLRFKELQNNLRTRSKILMKMREFLIHHLQFVEIETPTLFKRTPGGAREFIVPTHHENLYYSLVQSPQQLKQLLMVGGMDRYFQIARCYRDEATKPDRQPEFTQLDIELSFCTQDDVIKLVEDLLVHSWPGDVSIQAPFPRMTYAEAMETYGCDKPDLRYDWKITDFTEDFKVGAPNFMKDKSDDPSFRVCGIVAPKGHVVYTNAQKKATEEFLKEQHPQTMHFLFSAKNVEERMKSIFGLELGTLVLTKLNPKDDGTVFMAAGSKPDVLESVGKFRIKWADMMEEKGLRVRTPKTLNFLWITDFPLFNKDPNGVLQSNHHPFTAPRPEDENCLFDDPLKVTGLHYDLVLNGSEIGGGSIRIHNGDTQERVLKDILNLPTDALTHLLAGLRSGAPPHGGIALGIDRLIAIMVGANSIRDVIAFPKSVEGRDPMSGAPSLLTEEEKSYYHLKPKI